MYFPAVRLALYFKKKGQEDQRPRVSRSCPEITSAHRFEKRPGLVSPHHCWGRDMIFPARLACAEITGDIYSPGMCAKDPAFIADPPE